MRIGDDEQVELLDALGRLGMRVTVLPPWPMTTIAFRLSVWATCSFGSSVASNHRVEGMPGVSIIFLSAKRESIQS